ncbi:MAG: hypothetical protein AAFU67_07750, partial [Bacteroidota bacterium]
MFSLRPVVALWSALFLVFSCTTDAGPPKELEPNYWLVTGNGLGLRGKYLDVGQLVTFIGDTLFLEEALPNNGYQYRFKIQDSSVWIQSDTAWQIKSLRPDSLNIIDVSNGNMYYLKKLIPNTTIVSDTFFNNKHYRFVFDQTECDFFFAGETGDWQAKQLKCYRCECKSQWRDNGEWQIRDYKNSYWKLFTEYPQPILAMSQGPNG